MSTKKAITAIGTVGVRSADSVRCKVVGIDSGGALLLEALQDMCQKPPWYGGESYGDDELKTYGVNTQLDVSKCYAMIWYEGFVADVVATVQAAIVEHPICRCEQCSNGSPFSNPNMTEGRFLCFGCRSTHGWKWRANYLPGVK